MLPAVRIGSVAGLLNFIDEEGIDLYRLGQTLQLDVDEIYPIVQAADILQLIELKEVSNVTNNVQRHNARKNQYRSSPETRQPVLLDYSLSRSKGGTGCPKKRAFPSDNLSTF